MQHLKRLVNRASGPLGDGCDENVKAAGIVKGDIFERSPIGRKRPIDQCLVGQDRMESWVPAQRGRGRKGWDRQADEDNRNGDPEPSALMRWPRLVLGYSPPRAT